MFVMCAHCGLVAEKTVGAANRAKRQGARMYCDRVCAGLARRRNRTDADKKEAKRLYDQQYRATNADRIRARKAAYHKRIYDPAKAAIERKKRAKEHAAYCRRPEYKAWKKIYDRQYRAKKYYGDFWESYLLLLGLNDEIASQASRYEVYAENDTLNKRLKRMREYETQSYR